MDMLSVAQYGFAPALASALMHSLWQDTLLAVAAALLLSALGRASASWRHAVGMAFLVAMLVVPIAQFLRFWQLSAAGLDVGLLPVVAAPQLDAARGVFVQGSDPIAGIVVLSWLFGAAAMLVRHVGGLRLLDAMERSAWEPLPAEWQRRVRELQAAMGITRDVLVRMSKDVATPFAARLLRPVVWLPLSLLCRVPAEQLEAILAHELAHIARRDWLWNGLQCVIESLLFFHPAAWWLGRRIRQEREHACDDLAVAACGDAIALAEALTTLECQRHRSPRLALAAQGGSLMQRISRLLAVPPSRGRWGARAAFVTLLASGVVLAALAGSDGGPDLQVTASTTGVLKPGDFREIVANGIDRKRFYRASVDAQGRLTEVYRENGRDHPIDRGARDWIDGVERMNATWQPPIQLPDATPIVQLVSADPRVVEKLGAPVTLASSALPNGTLRGDGAQGDADLSLDLRGPKGRATVRTSALLRHGQWRITALRFE